MNDFIPLIPTNNLAYSENLELHDGIWYSKTTDIISYPDKGNRECFSIEDNSYWFSHRNNVLKRVISIFSKGKQFFDIGGGNGFVTKALKEVGFDAWLVEPGQDGILNAKERGVVNLINATIESAGFKTGTLDNIGLFDVLEHIKSDKETIDKLFQATSPGGKIFITAPAYSFLWSEADVKAGHFRRYSLKTIKRLIESAGFNVLYETYFFSFLVPLIFFVKTIPWFIIKRKSIESVKGAHNAKSKIVQNIISRLCKFEQKIISLNKKIFFGSSCLIVAEKP